ncbi:hypothetical protein V8E36_007895 [Tilletia maclaganii]
MHASPLACPPVQRLRNHILTANRLDLLLSSLFLCSSTQEPHRVSSALPPVDHLLIARSHLALLPPPPPPPPPPPSVDSRPAAKRHALCPIYLLLLIAAPRCAAVSGIRRSSIADWLDDDQTRRASCQRASLPYGSRGASSVLCIGALPLTHPIRMLCLACCSPFTVHPSSNVQNCFSTQLTRHLSSFPILLRRYNDACRVVRLVQRGRTATVASNGSQVVAATLSTPKANPFTDHSDCCCSFV